MRQSRAGLTGVCALLAAATLDATVALAAVQPPGQVEGEVLQVFATAMVIKNDRGEVTVLQLSAGTRLGAAFKPGDKVVAHVTPYGVSSVQPKTTTAVMP